MAMWPFKRRRRGASPQEEKTRSTHPETSAVTGSSEPKTSALPRTVKTFESTSLRDKKQLRRTSQQPQPPTKPWVDLEKRPSTDNNKENVPAGYISREDITALPKQRRLHSSPHLRPVDQERARIPYNFRPYSATQTSLQENEALASLHRPSTRFSEQANTLRSKRSTIDYSAPMRKSSRRDRRRDERVREEEIRQLASSPIPIPKRAGEGPLRRDSKKFRGTGLRDSNVSLPAEGSIHSSMSGAREQRGWEVGSFDIFNPRPAVRLSGIPQYVVSRDSVAHGSGVLYTIESRAGKGKAPMSRSSTRNDKIVGDEADVLGSGDIRMIMEREAKRKQKRDQERQEKLDRRLRGRAARDRADSENTRRGAMSDKRLDDARLRAAEQIQARQPAEPPAAIHPALRGDTVMSEGEEAVGLGIGNRPEPPSKAPQDDDTDDPFSDAQEHIAPHESAIQDSPTLGGARGTPDTPFEDAVVQTATAVRMSQAYTPPLSPIYSRGAAPVSAVQLSDAARQPSTSYQSTSHYSMQSVSDLTKPPPINPEPRRSSDTTKDRRSGSTWATIFRRPSAFRKSQPTAKPSPSQLSFSNTSRDSMRNQPIPAHLIDPRAGRPSTRALSIGGNPVRTQSRFHEDLPGMPLSPPDSRTQSPDVPIAAAVAATQLRSGRHTPQQPIDMIRTDTPTSLQNRGPKVSASLASIDSEGSWLASGSMKRASHQSAISHSLVGSKRTREFASPSFEDLGGSEGIGHPDQDAEYLARNFRRKDSNPTLIGATPDEESEDEEEQTLAASSLAASNDPALKVHGSARRRPTLVQRDDRLKSREGLVSEYLSSATNGRGGNPSSYHGVLENSHDVSSLDSDDELDSPIVELERATSVKYGSRHSRQFSAGSARLLDVKSTEKLGRERTPTPTMGLREDEGEDAMAGAER